MGVPILFQILSVIMISIILMINLLSIQFMTDSDLNSKIPWAWQPQYIDWLKFWRKFIIAFAYLFHQV